jgi:hypothetical protein
LPRQAWNCDSSNLNLLCSWNDAQLLIEMESHELFARAGLRSPSSKSLPPK